MQIAPGNPTTGAPSCCSRPSFSANRTRLLAPVAQQSALCLRPLSPAPTLVGLPADHPVCFPRSTSLLYFLLYQRIFGVVRVNKNLWYFYTIQKKY
jgi:hypothetical protein